MDQYEFNQMMNNMNDEHLANLSKFVTYYRMAVSNLENNLSVELNSNDQKKFGNMIDKLLKQLGFEEPYSLSVDDVVTSGISNFSLNDLDNILKNKKDDLLL
jgi:hypothetical protein